MKNEGIRGKKMTEQSQVLNIVNENYLINFDSIEFVRDSGCVAYTVYSDECKYFLRVTKPMFFDTASKSLDIHLFLQKHDFAVPRIIFTKDGSPCVQVSDEAGRYFYVLYEFVEGEEVDPEQDAQKIGAFIGKLHSVMQGYSGELIKNDKHYYIDRYIDILRTKKYEKTYESLLPEYMKYSSLAKAETDSFYDLIALYHFALQATIIEIFGIDCVDNEFLDRQLRWLYKWDEQCSDH